MNWREHRSRAERRRRNRHRTPPEGQRTATGGVWVGWWRCLRRCDTLRSVKWRAVFCGIGAMTGVGVALAQPQRPRADEAPFAAEVDHGEPDDAELAAAPVDPAEAAMAAASATPDGTAAPAPAAGAP